MIQKQYTDHVVRTNASGKNNTKRTRTCRSHFTGFLDDLRRLTMFCRTPDRRLSSISIFLSEKVQNMRQVQKNRSNLGTEYLQSLDSQSSLRLFVIFVSIWPPFLLINCSCTLYCFHSLIIFPSFLTGDQPGAPLLPVSYWQQGR